MIDYVEPGYVRTGYIELATDTVAGVTFDGYARVMKISEARATMTAPELYSRWKAWVKTQVAQDDSLKWPIAMRYTGNDPIPGGFTGATFFVVNGWRIVFNPNTTSINGVIFSEDYPTAYWNSAMQPIFPITVSAVVNQVTTTQNVVTGDLGQVSDDVWDHIKALTVAKFLGLK